MKWISEKVEGLDQANPRTLLKINIFLSLFVALAHGLPLLLIKHSELPAGFGIGYFTAPAALIAALAGLVAHFRPALQQPVLKVHTAFLLLMGAYLLYFGISTLVVGIPEGTKFSWNPIFFAFVLAYPVYLARRFLIPDTAPQSIAVRYAHVSVFLGSFPISAAIIAKVAAQT